MQTFKQNKKNEYVPNCISSIRSAMVTDSNIPNGDISHSIHQQLQKLNIKSTIQPVVYKMDYPCRGKAVIVNQTRFDPMTGMSNREGTDPDIEGLDRVFSNLGFRTEAHSDLTIAEFRKLLIESKLSLEMIFHTTF